MSEESAATPAARGLQRTIGWRGAFWVASGVPPFVLFSVGGIAATVGPPSWLVWTLSILMGFVQAFVYAEIAGLFANKAGGASIYGAAAWIRYGRWFAPFSVWCNWLAWSPVMTLAAATAANYLRSFLPGDSALAHWRVTLLDLGFLKHGLVLRLDATWLFGVGLLLLAFLGQYRGILRVARIQAVVGVLVVLPILVIGIVPILSGEVQLANLLPLVPVKYGPAGEVLAGAPGTMPAGRSSSAACSPRPGRPIPSRPRSATRGSSAIPRATRRRRSSIRARSASAPSSPCRSPSRARSASPKMLEPGIYDGSGVAAALAGMVGGGPIVGGLLVVMMVFGLLLTIMTAMAGTSRTQYQAAVDGWFPRYLAAVNQHGAPVRAMLTDLVFNAVLLAFSDYLFVLAVSCCNYLAFNFLNLNSGWIHRIDNAHIRRPWRAPTPVMALGTVFAFVNALLLGAGASVWGEHALLIAVALMALIIPIFGWRHYVRDRGRFPAGMLDDLGIPDGSLGEHRAGLRPYFALIAGILIVLAGVHFFRLD